RISFSNAWAATMLRLRYWSSRSLPRGGWAATRPASHRPAASTKRVKKMRRPREPLQAGINGILLAWRQAHHPLAHPLKLPVAPRFRRSKPVGSAVPPPRARPEGANVPALPGERSACPRTRSIGGWLRLERNLAAAAPQVEFVKFVEEVSVSKTNQGRRR